MNKAPQMQRTYKVKVTGTLDGVEQSITKTVNSDNGQEAAVKSALTVVQMDLIEKTGDTWENMACEVLSESLPFNRKLQLTGDTEHNYDAIVKTANGAMVELAFYNADMFTEGALSYLKNVKFQASMDIYSIGGWSAEPDTIATLQYKKRGTDKWYVFTPDFKKVK